jgi:hypothetical protein
VYGCERHDDTNSSLNCFRFYIADPAYGFVKLSEEKYPKIYENFVDSGFIIQDSKDELNEIRFENRKRTFGNYFPLSIYL